MNKEHSKKKRAFIITATGIVIVAGGILLYKNSDTIIPIIKNHLNYLFNKSNFPVTNDKISKSAISLGKQPINSIDKNVDVCGHMRKLPDGWKASINKIEYAKKYDIPMLDGYTYVCPYSYIKTAA